ncbi:phosphodiester glycosidase family protein [Paenibacillus sp. GCM10012307]|uniref:Phosphodiester glycosidase family protein n=1 Tax=Paenibacillus roseus TaxID=2798579 RepID=A0A934J9C6_9BACL|nr:phosphodiester glycosidase family protein [Paenibacillus roseus]MBJ6363963.1 phosphodiester glycosidase family protein [Paenibacillus roseus]
MTIANTHKTTQNGKEVRYIIADLDCVSVVKIDGSVVNSNMYGINGTFFYGSSLLGVAVNNNAAVRTGGDQTANSSHGPGQTTKRGVLYHFDPAVNLSFMKTHVVKKYNDTTDHSGNTVGATANNVKWAIGGYSLHLQKTYTGTESAQETAYINDIVGNPEYANSWAGKTNFDGRSAIGYGATGPSGSNRTIVLATFENASVWEVRKFMKGLGCSMGVHLDGGGSSQLRYKRQVPAGSFLIDDSWQPDPDPNDPRKVYSMVRVNPTTWNNGSGF